MLKCFSLNSENDRLNNYIHVLQNGLDEIAALERKDCINFLQGEKQVYMTNGCYKGMDRFCSWTDRPKTCTDKLFPMCQNLED